MSIRVIEGKELSSFLDMWNNMTNYLKKHNVGPFALVQFFLDPKDNNLKPVVWYDFKTDFNINFLYGNKPINENVDSLSYIPMMYIVPPGDHLKNILWISQSNIGIVDNAFLNPIFAYLLEFVKKIVNENLVNKIEIDLTNKSISFLTALGNKIENSYCGIFPMSRKLEDGKIESFLLFDKLKVFNILSSLGNTEMINLSIKVASNIPDKTLTKEYIKDSKELEAVLFVDDLKIYPDMLKLTPEKVDIYKHYFNNEKDKFVAVSLELFTKKFISNVFFVEIPEATTNV